MAILIRTSDVPPEELRDAWRTVVCDTLGPLDLADPALGGAPVSAVAARWGLPDSAHFNRLFKRTYGLPPAEYRRVCLAPGG